MRIELDSQKCIGSGTCVGFAPTVFKLGADGVVQLLSDVDDGVEEAVAEAIHHCPTGVIRRAAG